MVSLALINYCVVRINELSISGDAGQTAALAALALGNTEEAAGARYNVRSAATCTVLSTCFETIALVTNSSMLYRARCSVCDLKCSLKGRRRLELDVTPPLVEAAGYKWSIHIHVRDQMYRLAALHLE